MLARNSQQSWKLLTICTKGSKMFNKLKKLLKNSTFLLFMNIAVAETVIAATFIYLNQVPSETILSTNLSEILMIFEG